ncbi:isochorismate synthase [Saxibacter everestensis]|uniref:isochorismate synthase n=1 Tax=Saxibacter everestensis TaxID=2909229 RepID=A0ABY8QPN7_9MICO|nr:isochorismate synthase [Brevibacteriaceae bacterium ZFBP1038]
MTVSASAPSATLRAHSYFVDGLAQHSDSPLGSELPTTPADFLSRLATSGITAWVRGHSGLVGWGECTRIETAGPDRFAAADAAWRQLVAAGSVRDEVRLPGSGAIAFGSFTFADDSEQSSVLIVPRLLLGRYQGRVWLTVMSLTTDEAAATANPLNSHRPLSQHNPLRKPEAVTVRTGSLDEAGWQDAVVRVVERLRAGDAEKAVLARDVFARAAEPIDVRYVLGVLNATYPSCWTFHIDGLLGATPELLISSHRGEVRSRVLAGTYRTTGDRDADVDAARVVLSAHKDSSEHRYAIDSLTAALRPLCSTLDVDPEPFMLELANVIHLASDAHGELTQDADGSRPSSLAVAATVHPTAAVGGTPTGDAVRIIADEEGMDRGRYSGPVGWMDGNGDGEWAIALRCGQFTSEARDELRLFAGCGIVADSEPGSELEESTAKLAPMLSGLGVEM